MITATQIQTPSLIKPKLPSCTLLVCQGCGEKIQFHAPYEWKKKMIRKGDGTYTTQRQLLCAKCYRMDEIKEQWEMETSQSFEFEKVYIR